MNIETKKTSSYSSLSKRKTRENYCDKCLIFYKFDYNSFATHILYKKHLFTICDINSQKNLLRIFFEIKILDNIVFFQSLNPSNENLQLIIVSILIQV